MKASNVQDSLKPQSILIKSIKIVAKMNNMNLILDKELYSSHPVVYIVFNYLCYNRRHNKQSGNILNKDNRC
jgi:hypothetical protein